MNETLLMHSHHEDSTCSTNTHTHKLTHPHKHTVQFILKKLHALGFVTKQQSRIHGSVSDVKPCVVFGQRPVVTNRYAIVASLTQALQTSIDSHFVICVGSEMCDCQDRQGDTQRATQPVLQTIY